MIHNGRKPTVSKRVLSDADAACYVAKRKGRNRTHFHSVNDVDLGSAAWRGFNGPPYIAEALETEEVSAFIQPADFTAEPCRPPRRTL